jgi:hypothetical protein
MHIPRRCRLPLPLPTPDENDSIMMFLMKWDGLGPVTVLPERLRTLCGVPARGPELGLIHIRIDCSIASRLHLHAAVRRRRRSRDRGDVPSV